jgi:hypothetical protein
MAASAVARRAASGRERTSADGFSGLVVTAARDDGAHEVNTSVAESAAARIATPRGVPIDL